MTNAELIAKIKAEIDKRYTEYSEKKKTDDLIYYEGMADALDLFEQFIDTLESKKPMNLEGEINRYLREECSDDDEPSIHEIAEHFAQWGAEHSGDSEIPKDLLDAQVEIVEKLIGENNNDGANAAHPFACEYVVELLQKAVSAGAKWQADHAPLPEDTVLFNKGVEEGKRLMMEDYPKWRRIKAGERLPCPAYVWTIAYDNYPDCFEGRLMPNIQGVKVGRDTWYLPVDVIHNLPKEDEK